MAAPGIYGKLPSRGDFVTRRLGRTFIDPWDGWLQTSMRTAEERLGDAWLESYLTAPIWRFAIAGGTCGNTAMGGIVMPSVDRVGRYFPLTIASELPAGLVPFAAPVLAAAWYDRIEAAALTALDDGVDLDDVDSSVEAIGPPPEGTAKPAPEATPWRIAVGGACDLAPGYMPFALAGRQALPRGVWWTSGSDRVEPSLVGCDGLPSFSGFVAFLDGRFDDRGFMRPEAA